MPFFVVERSSVDSSLSIPLPDAYPTREAAIAALSAAGAAGRVTLTGEVFIADLDSAIPVLVMQPIAAPVVVPPTEDADTESPAEETVEPGEPEPVEPEAVEPEAVEPEAEEPESAEPAMLDEVAADDVYTSWEPLPAAQDGAPSLADALKRATTTLEDEGIVAPDSIESAPVPGINDDTAAVAALLASLSGEVAVEPGVSAPVGDSASSTAGEWPWANVEAYEIPKAVEVEADEDGAPEADATEDAALESTSIITSAPPAGEDAYLPRPVILGDYPDAPVIEADDLIAGDESEVDSPAVETETTLLDDVTTGDEPAVAAYEATGELDLSEYTCQDCVYSNTCPKVGESSPADCGSFQWRSE